MLLSLASIIGEVIMALAIAAILATVSIAVVIRLRECHIGVRDFVNHVSGTPLAGAQALAPMFCDSDQRGVPVDVTFSSRPK